jgi:hypothetical protein
MESPIAAMLSGSGGEIGALAPVAWVGKQRAGSRHADTNTVSRIPLIIRPLFPQSCCGPVSNLPSSRFQIVTMA